MSKFRLTYDPDKLVRLDEIVLTRLDHVRGGFLAWLHFRLPDLRELVRVRTVLALTVVVYPPGLDPDCAERRLVRKDELHAARDDIHIVTGVDRKNWPGQGLSDNRAVARSRHRRAR